MSRQKFPSAGPGVEPQLHIEKSVAVVSTSERRPYGCFILVKGIIGPDGNVV